MNCMRARSSSARGMEMLARHASQDSLLLLHARHACPSTAASGLAPAGVTFRDCCFPDAGALSCDCARLDVLQAHTSHASNHEPAPGASCRSSWLFSLPN